MNVILHMKFKRQRLSDWSESIKLALSWSGGHFAQFGSKEVDYQQQQMQCHTLELNSIQSLHCRVASAGKAVVQLGDLLLQSLCKAIRSSGWVQFSLGDDIVELNLLLPDIPTCGKWSATAFASRHPGRHRQTCECAQQRNTVSRIREIQMTISKEIHLIADGRNEFQFLENDRPHFCI